MWRIFLKYALVISAALGLIQMQDLRAEPVQRAGVEFSEASGNFRIIGLTGDGTRVDPFVLTEEITGPGEAILAVRVEDPKFQNRAKTFHAIGFVLRKVVINRSGVDWQHFNIELEREIGLSSDYYDGLSFAQMSQASRPFKSDRFAQIDDVSEPYDALHFSDGLTAVGEIVSFQFAVTDTQPKPVFFLVQHRRQPVADAGAWRRYSQRPPVLGTGGDDGAYDYSLIAGRPYVAGSTRPKRLAMPSP